MQKKYELTDDKIRIYGEDADLTYNFTLSRIRALHDIPMHNVKIGDFGGYIESESNLSQEGDAWVAGNAQIFGSAIISDNALVSGSAQVYGHAKVNNTAEVSNGAKVFGNAEISGDAKVIFGAEVYGNAH